MAIRYSGDVEIRFSWDPVWEAYHATVRDPFSRWSGMYWERGFKRGSDPEQTERAARGIARRANRELQKKFGESFVFKKDKSGRIVLSSVFQSPCPVCPHERALRKRLTRKANKRRM